jgi:hypothetical protein
MRNEERERLREACAEELRELREADDDETTDAVIDAAARTAARVQQLSRPESDAPRAWHKNSTVRIVGAIIGAVLASAVAALFDALSKAGVIK